MNYHETTFMRYLKRLRPSAKSCESDEADVTNVDEEETLEVHGILNNYLN